VSGKALQGLKVLELAQFVAGPYCAKLLADLGAEVLKIEEPLVGDEARRRGPFLNDVPHPERSGLFLYVNTNKMGVTLNINTGTGREIFKRLVDWADILIEDKPPGAMEELGLDYDSLRAINPRLIMTSITPFGQTGPYRDYKAYHLNIIHSAGAGYVTPGEVSDLNREPLKGGGLLDDYTSGLTAAVATMGAAYSQWATDLGQHIDVSRQEAVMQLDKVEIGQYPNDGTIPSRRQRTSSVIPCKDGYFHYVTPRDYDWEAFAKVMGNPDWATDERLKLRTFQDEKGEELKERISQWSLGLTKEEIYHQAQTGRVPLGAIRTAEEVVNWPQREARGFFAEIDHPEAGKFKYPSAPYLFSETPWAATRPAPLLGQHNEEVYCRRLGYTRQELVQMREAGII
jgi:CoA:oxalate CoA-transferase